MKYLLIVLLLLLPTAVRADERKMVLAGLNITVWSPPPGEHQPVVLFSHGFHGGAAQSRQLMRALASAGYWVVAPNHRDAGGLLRAHDRFPPPNDWTEATFRDRDEDLRALWKALTPKRFPGIDRSRVALVGHSLGGYTVLCAAGARPTWQIPGCRVRAVVALSPYTLPLLHGELSHLRAPVMYQGGTLDYAITPTVRRPGGAYEQSPSPKTYVEFRGAGHLSWTNLRPHDAELIARYAVAFLNHYVRGASPDPILSTRLPGVTDLRSGDQE